MDAADHRAFIRSFEESQAELTKLVAYRDRFEAFNGFIEQALCEKVQVSREKPGEKSIKLLLVLKRPTRPVLVVKVPRYGPHPEPLDTILWGEPKEFSDEGVLLGIKKPIGSVLLIRSTFKNASGARCQTMFFANPTDDILSVRSRIQYFEKKIEEQNGQYVASKEALALGKIANVADPSAPKGSPGSL